jgi:hypothetical protein
MESLLLDASKSNWTLSHNGFQNKQTKTNKKLHYHHQHKNPGDSRQLFRRGPFYLIWHDK